MLVLIEETCAVHGPNINRADGAVDIAHRCSTCDISLCRTCFAVHRCPSSLPIPSEPSFEEGGASDGMSDEDVLELASRAT